MSRSLLVVHFVIWSHAALNAGDWPQWRGPQRNAVADERGLLAEWKHPPPVVWRADNLGDGYSSVAVASGRVFTLGKFGDEVRCVAVDDASGELVWTSVIGSSKRHAMSTPTYVGGLVYALDPDGKLACLNAETGDLVWSKDLDAEFAGKLMSSRGYGESPLVDDDRVICTPGGPDAFMVAMDRRTSDVVWKAVVPPIGPKGSDGAAFSSIVATEACGLKQYVQLTGRGLIGIDAENGRFLWGYNDICGGGINIPTPVVRADLVFTANGYNAGSALLKLEPGGETGVTAREVYRLRGTDFQNHHGGVALIGEYIYGGHGSNNGLPTCLELATGKWCGSAAGRVPVPLRLRQPMGGLCFAIKMVLSHGLPHRPRRMHCTARLRFPVQPATVGRTPRSPTAGCICANNRRCGCTISCAREARKMSSPRIRKRGSGRRKH